MSSFRFDIACLRIDLRNDKYRQPCTTKKILDGLKFYGLAYIVLKNVDVLQIIEMWSILSGF